MNYTDTNTDDLPLVHPDCEAPGEFAMILWAVGIVACLFAVILTIAGV